MEYAVALLAVAGLGYFIYTRVKAAKARRAKLEANPPVYGGGGRSLPSKQVEK